MDIYIVRHPETQGNVNKIIYGKSHYPYTMTGEEQVNTILGQLEKINIEKIIASPLKRTKDLAEAIAYTKDVSLECDQRLEEMGFGILENLTLGEVEKQHPKVYEHYLNHYETYTIPNGENFLDFRKRVVSFAKELANMTHSSVLIVSHGRVIKEMLEYLLNLKEGQGWDYKIKHGQLMQVVYQNGQGQLFKINDNHTKGEKNNE
ncbi:adenosylcobalamin phosphatase [Natranaerovirga hydrolytica]|uniref:Adenosylcobalamin phosphatase n=1 Tax=Natranaerovirga hydrolytica TaxID=680378 RepID=A0A4R1MZL2_9FIRM|nr:histidine phosphatase family protein [Natranaerovirga hydrolytica]TCK98625.1 adenosylcobalamin phosphatase [Natranaerovirga hydrolytica]